jgi:hypothetical protein
MNAAVLQSLKDKLRHRWPGEGVRSQIAGIDELLGPTGLARGAIHEVLSPARRGVPRLFALLLARAALGSGAIVWCCEKEEDTREGSASPGTWYPPAAAAMGIPAERLILLKPGDAKQTLWALAECLRCKGVSVTIARLKGKLGSLDARRLQLAAEAGGGIGVLLRSVRSGSAHGISEAGHYAAATRWLVEPAPGEALVQRWKVTLLHGGFLSSASGGSAYASQGGHIDSTLGLEVHRETHAITTSRFIQTDPLHPPQKLADQSAQTKTLRPAGSRRIA